MPLKLYTIGLKCSFSCDSLQFLQHILYTHCEHTSNATKDECVSANHYLQNCEPQTAFHNHDMLTLHFNIFPEL